ncbi:MAG: stage V sporulation protein AD [Clostridia bacterium]|nr:stage V sporulation protein AD [Clostridia bacterium]
MAERIGHYTLGFTQPPYVLSFAAVGGKKEGEGPLGQEFDRIFPDPYLGKATYELAESELQKQAFSIALEKAGLTPDKIHYLFAGDLLNQCVGSTVGLSGFGIPHVGIYGACSTMALGLLLAACFVDTHLANIAAAVTSSHFCSSERQFRFPLEYGGQRPQTASWTATAAGSILLSQQKTPVAVKAATIGRIQDLGIKDANNMGAAMAPAAADTIVTFLKDTGMSPTDFDMILTGDLGQTGSDLVRQLTLKEGYDIAPVQRDCGLNLYHMEEQDVHAGGSGCGCSAGVLCSRILKQLEQGDLHRILFVATGSLHSPTSVQQGTPIPGIAHGVWLEHEEQ